MMEKQFCTKCGAPLREGAKFCIKCGAPVKSFDEGKTNVSPAGNLKIKNERPPIVEKSDNIVLDKNVVQNSDIRNETNEDPLHNNSNNNLPDTSNKMAFYAVILIVVLFVAGCFYCYKNNVFSRPVNMTAEQLMSDYRRTGSLAADKKYKGKKLAISGTVVRISNFTNADKIGDLSDTDKTKCITMYQWSYNGTRYVVNLGVPADRKDIINNIHVGDHIVATGNFLGFSEQQKGLSIFVIGMNTSDIKKQ